MPGLWFPGDRLQPIKINPDRRSLLLSPTPFRPLVYEQDEQTAHPRRLEGGSTLKWLPASLFAQLPGKTRTKGNGINQGGSCPWGKKKIQRLVRKSQPSKVQVGGKEPFSLNTVTWLKCCLVTNLPFQVTTVFYDLGSVGRHNF